MKNGRNGENAEKKNQNRGTIMPRHSKKCRGRVEAEEFVPTTNGLLTEDENLFNLLLAKARRRERRPWEGTYSGFSWTSRSG